MKWISIIVLITTINLSILQAETFTLTEREKACIETLKSCDKTVEAGKKVIKDQQDIIDIRKKEVDELSKALVKANSIVRNPWLWFVLGLAAGGITAGVLIKR